MIKCKKIEFYPLMTSNAKEKMIAMASNVSIKSKTKIFQKIFLHIFLPLIIGCIIYLFGRNNTWLNENLHGLYINSAFQNTSFYKIVVYNVPDFCWDYSLASALFLWGRYYFKNKKLLAVIIFLILILSETIQIFFPKTFTFDWLDECAAMLAFLLSYSLNYRK